MYFVVHLHSIRQLQRHINKYLVNGFQKYIHWPGFIQAFKKAQKIEHLQKILAFSRLPWRRGVYWRDCLWWAWSRSWSTSPWASEQPRKGTRPRCWTCECRTQSRDSSRCSPKIAMEDCKTTLIDRPSITLLSYILTSVACLYMYILKIMELVQ